MAPDPHSHRPVNPLVRAQSGMRWLLGYRGIGPMARPTFRRDLISQVLASLAIGMMVPDLTQFLMAKGFEGSAWMLAIIEAQAAGGHFVGAWITQYIQKLRRVKVILTIRAAVSAALLAIAFLPVRPESAWFYIALLTVPAIAHGVVINVRNSIRHANYPSGGQGRITARLIVFHLACVSLAMPLAGYVLDNFSGGYRLLYILSAVLNLLSALPLLRLRVRNEPQLLRRSRSVRFDPLASFRVLLHDPIYRRFMFWQMLSGSTVLMTRPIAAEVLAAPEYFGVAYTSGTLARVTLPSLVALVMTLPAGHFFDSARIMSFRSANAAFWAASRMLFFVGVVTLSWPLVVVAFAFEGLGRALGGMAFNLGHMRFSKPEQSQLYMGTHLALVGVRGMTMPFLGAWLFGISAIGPWVFVLLAGVQFIAAIGFYRTREPQVQD
jgi:hypothetical protein